MFGQQIITSVSCYEVQTIKRTWRERLLSWPWRPWVAFKTFHKPAAYRMGNQIVCHPAMLSEIQKAAQHRVQADALCDCYISVPAKDYPNLCAHCGKTARR